VLQRFASWERHEVRVERYRDLEWDKACRLPLSIGPIGSEEFCSGSEDLLRLKSIACGVALSGRDVARCHGR
jgi:hypothetical protein